MLQTFCRLADTIAVPKARAAIFWMIGEYNQQVKEYAPDVLRKAAKSRRGGFIQTLEGVKSVNVLNECLYGWIYRRMLMMFIMFSWMLLRMLRRGGGRSFGLSPP